MFLLLIFGLFSISCSKTPESTKVLYFSSDIQESYLEDLEKLGQTRDWELIVTDNEEYLTDDSLSQMSALFLPFSSLNHMDYETVPALKRYLEAAGGGIVTVSDTILTQNGWP